MNPDKGAEGQRAVRGRHGVHVISLAARRGTTIEGSAVPGSNAFLTLHDGCRRRGMVLWWAGFAGGRRARRRGDYDCPMMAGGPEDRQRPNQYKTADSLVLSSPGFGVESLDHDFRFRLFLRQDLRVMVSVPLINSAKKITIGHLPILSQDGPSCDGL